MNKIKTIKRESVPLLNENNYETSYECPICFESVNEFNITTTNCNHSFHKKCLDIWLEENFDCPMCRKLICTKFLAKYVRNPFFSFFYKKCALIIDINRKMIMVQLANKIEMLQFCDIKEVYLNRNYVIFNYRIQPFNAFKFTKLNYGFKNENSARVFFSILIKIFKA